MTQSGNASSFISGMIKGFLRGLARGAERPNEEVNQIGSVPNKGASHDFIGGAVRKIVRIFFKHIPKVIKTVSIGLVKMTIGKVLGILRFNGWGVAKAVKAAFSQSFSEGFFNLIMIFLEHISNVFVNKKGEPINAKEEFKRRTSPQNRSYYRSPQYNGPQHRPYQQPSFFDYNNRFQTPVYDQNGNAYTPPSQNSWVGQDGTVFPTESAPGFGG